MILAPFYKILIIYLKHIRIFVYSCIRAFMFVYSCICVCILVYPCSGEKKLMYSSTLCKYVPRLSIGCHCKTWFDVRLLAHQKSVDVSHRLHVTAKFKNCAAAFATKLCKGDYHFEFERNWDSLLLLQFVAFDAETNN